MKQLSAATRAMLDELRGQSEITPDKLDRVRDAVSQLRDDEMRAAMLTEELGEVNKKIKFTKERTLVDVFDEAGITSLKLDAEGNKPAFACEMGDHYFANIPAERADEAYEHLRGIGQEDLIKTAFTIQFGLREAKQADRFRRSLEKAGIEFTEKNGVPWNTLTAWFKVEHKRKPLPAKAMELLGATVHRVVKVVKQKEKK